MFCITEYGPHSIDNQTWAGFRVSIWSKTLRTPSLVLKSWLFHKERRTALFSEPVMSCIVFDMILSWLHAISSKETRSWRASPWRVSVNMPSLAEPKNLPKPLGNFFVQQPAWLSGVLDTTSVSGGLKALETKPLTDASPRSCPK